jgi:hypothetical protein
LDRRRLVDRSLILSRWRAGDRYANPFSNVPVGGAARRKTPLFRAHPLQTGGAVERKDDRGDRPIAEDVREAYEESDVPRGRTRAREAERNAERSGQAEEPPGADDRGTGSLESSER